MKESNYNFYITDSEDNLRLIYNAFKNTLVRDDDCNIQNYISQCKRDVQYHPDTISEKNFNSLVSSGIIVSNDMDEKQIAIDINKKRLEKLHQKNDSLSLVITPTLQCNFKCSYCFESTAIRKGEEVLSMKVQDDIIDFISKSITQNHIKEVDIKWYGGEPLLHQQIIFSMQQKIINLCKLFNVKFSSDIVTNGLLLTPETSKSLYEYGIKKAQVTIDGPEIIHNKRRFYPADPINNYKIILDNLLKANENIHINVRINIDQTNKDLIFSLIDDLIKRKIWPYKKNVSIYMAKVFSDNRNINLSKEEFAIFEDQARLYLTKRYNEIAKSEKAKLRVPDLRGNQDDTNLNRQVKLVAGNTVSVSFRWEHK